MNHPVVMLQSLIYCLISELNPFTFGRLTRQRSKWLRSAFVSVVNACTKP